MKKQLYFLSLLTCFFIVNNSYSQNITSPDKSQGVVSLFKNQEILPIKLSYSSKDIKRLTNDSTYIDSELSYSDENGTWKTLPVEMRVRGNFRKKNCYFSPIRLKIKKSNSKETLIEGNKKLKLVLPCFKQESFSDNIVKEYLAYKLYEIISPYHFKTRLLNIDFEEPKGKKMQQHELIGIFIEDTKNVEKRYNGKLLKRPMHPLNQDAEVCVRNAFFQYMIANTDYSTAYQHNEKLFFFDEKILPVPYDFDMSGLVNANYAVVSQIQNEQLPITHVTQRLFRGFKRDGKIEELVRQDLINKKPEILAICKATQVYFKDQKEYQKCEDFVMSFFDVMMDDNKFEREIIKKGRTK